MGHGMDKAILRGEKLDTLNMVRLVCPEMDSRPLLPAQPSLINGLPLNPFAKRTRLGDSSFSMFLRMSLDLLGSCRLPLKLC